MSRRSRDVFLLRITDASAPVFSIHKHLRRLASGLTALLLAIPIASQANFTTPGSFNVAPDGSASYSIPIHVPPGTGGMSPQLALSYNSNGGNGVAGMGWGLSGLSQITRCPQTIAQDGAVRGIQFDLADRYCIDGQRLISTGGNHGADSTEYRTEIANFAKIVSYGVAGNGPAWFKVWTKAGQIVEYGNTEDSRIEAQGKDSVFTWAANKVSDTKGNYLAISYLENHASGETLLNRIDYTGNAAAGLIPYASIRFDYEARPDTNVAYLGGSAITSSQRLKSIRTYHGDALVKDYRLAYEQSQSSKRSRLKTLTECDRASTCQLPHSFGWQDRNNGFTDNGAIATAYGNWDGKSNRIWPMDVNGDGLQDIVLGPESNGNWYVLRSTGTSLVDDGIWLIGYGNWYDNADRIRPMDVNGDGLEDMVLGPNGAGEWFILKSTGNGFVDQGAVLTGAYGNWNDKTDRIRPMDVNGDGLQDIVIGPDSSGNWHVLRSTGNGFVNDGAWITGAYGNFNDAANRIRPMDINGDGLQDIVIGPQSNGNWYVLRSTGTAFVNEGIWTTAYGDWSDKAKRIRQMDVNGDGLQDIVIGPSADVTTVTVDASFNIIKKTTPGGHWYILRSTGSAFVNDGAWISGAYARFSNAESRITPMDINGDGLQDILIGPESNGNWYVLRSTGTAFLDEGIWVTAYGNWHDKAERIRPMDISGDGLQDMLAGPSSAGQWYLLRGDPPADQLTSIANGDGQLATITYKPLTDPSLYIKDSGALAAAYPTEDIQDALYVVASVSIADGIGGNITTNYTYGGAKADLSGRGFLGFRWNKASSPDTNTNITSFYHQTYPYTGLIAQAEKRTNDGALLSVAGNSYASKALSAGNASSLFPFAAMSLEHQYEMDGSLISSTATGYQYDDWGNATQVTAISNDGHIKTTNSTYANDSANWLLGRMLRTSVTSTAPDAASSASALGISVNPEQLAVNATAPGAISASATLTVSGGVPPYTYGWSRMNGSRINASGAQTGIFSTTIEAGETLTETFRATVIDSAGNIGSTDLPVTFTLLAPYVFNATLTANTGNYNLKNAAIAAGWDQIAPLQATITINSGVIVGSSSTSGYAFDTGSGIPAGSVLTLVNNGKILGAGGNGGSGGTPYSSNSAGQAGGAALRVQAPLRIDNKGIIGGGGGGAAGQPASMGGKGGGGGQGYKGGNGGAKGMSSTSIITATAGTSGTATSAGSPGGGALGSAGTSYGVKGGTGGACATGSQLIKWLSTGTRHGALN